MSDNFSLKDSGKRMEFETGMQRDSGEKILRPDLLWLPGLIRLAELYGKGAVKYAERNWEKAKTEVELLRFRASAFRHFMQWFRGDRDEDHCSAVIFNMWGAEYTTERMGGYTKFEILDRPKLACKLAQATGQPHDPNCTECRKINA